MIRAVVSGIGLIFAGYIGALATSQTAQAERTATIAEFETLEPELHVVGVYHGRDSERTIASGACSHAVCDLPAWPDRSQDVLPIELSRPGPPVTLVVGSYAALNWDIRVDEHTKLEEVIVIGYGTNKAAVAVNGELRNDVLRYRQISATYKTYGPDFRTLVEELPSQIGFEQISSFQGNYRAPSSGFVINGPIDQPELQPNYLDGWLQEPQNAELTFEASLHGQVGEFQLDGTLVVARTPIDTPRTRLSTARDRRYRWDQSRSIVNVVDATNKRVVSAISAPRGAVRGHFHTMILDEKRNRLLLAFQAGALESQIFAVNLSTLQWEELGTTGRTQPTAFYYDAPTDTFLISFNDLMKKAGIGRLSANGEFEVLRTISASDLPGMTDLFDPENDMIAPFYILGAQDHHVVLAAGRRGLFSINRNSKQKKRVYEVNLETGEARLTFYE